MAKIMVVIGFLVAFAAGLAVGFEMRRTSHAQAPTTTEPPVRTTGPSTRGSRSPGGWIASELKLDAEQRKKMDAIWSDVARGGREESDKERDALRKKRDEAILALVGADNKAKYDDIQKQYRDDQQAMERKMRGRFEKAVEETKAILTPEQREKYEQLLARHRPPDRDGSRDGGRGRGASNGPGGPRGTVGSDRDNVEHRHGESGASATSRPQPQLQPQP
jgi:Spy/CpxP family protein refolding chaperone